MVRLSLTRRLLRAVHPETIPWPFSVLYNALSASAIFQRHYDLVAGDILNYCPEGSILDVGTGPGRLLLKLHEFAPALRLTGLDASAAMAAQARRNAARAGLCGAIEIREGYADRMPFADESFSAVVSTGSVHHWKNPSGGFNEIYRVLKRGGHALLYDVVNDTPDEILREAAREFGGLRTLAFWLHGFEEPFYSREDYALLARPTLFKPGPTDFVGVLFRLILRKE